jgi:hypothetical protein
VREGSSQPWVECPSCSQSSSSCWKRSRMRSPTGSLIAIDPDKLRALVGGANGTLRQKTPDVKHSAGVITGWAVSSGWTPTSPSLSSSRLSTNTSTVRTGSSSVTSSSSDAGNSVLCPRSNPWDKALHQMPRKSSENLIARITANKACSGRTSAFRGRPGYGKRRYAGPADP